MDQPTMRAVLIRAYGEAPEVTEVPVPAAPDGGVLVRVMATGLCRSDWHAWAGHDEDVSLPHIPGHELAGVIEAVGAGVKRWRVGQRVTSPFVEGCGHCDLCRAGQAQVCPNQTQPGFSHDGSFAQFVALRAADVNLVEIPDDISFAAAASLGCRFATAFHGLVDRARLGRDEWVTVVGAGGVGLSAVMIAHALGARVIAVDRTPAALDLARRLGADHALLADDSTVEQIAELTGGGAHVAVDAVGTETTCQSALAGLRRQGRLLQIGLFAPLADRFPGVDLNHVVMRELELLGTHGMAAAAYPAMLDLIAVGALAPQRLIEATIGLEEAARRLPQVDRLAPAGMTMIDPWA